MKSHYILFAALWFAAVIVIIALADTGGAPLFFAWVERTPGSDKAGHFFLIGGMALMLNLALRGMRVPLLGRRWLLGSMVVVALFTRGGIFAEIQSSAAFRLRRPHGGLRRHLVRRLVCVAHTARRGRVLSACDKNPGLQCTAIWQCMAIMRYPQPPAHFGAVFALLLAGTAFAQEVKIPAPPPGHVLDTARVFSPEQAERLSAALLKAAREDNIQVYVATLHSAPKGQLSAIGDAITRNWTGTTVGGTLVFDDQFGEVTVGTSDETDRRFTPLVINMVMREPLMMGRKQGISPDKLERAAYSVIGSLKSLVDKERRERRGKWVANALMAIVALVGGTITGLAAWGRRKRELAGETDTPESPKAPDSAG